MTLYDREFKRLCLQEVLAHYSSFLDVAHYPEDARLVFLLTMCRMLDRARAEPATREPRTDASSDPWNLRAISENQQRLFARYKFDDRVTEAANIDRFLERLLDPPADSTVRFL